jgi:hypothetical protein
MMTASRPPPSKQHLHPRHSYFRLACRSVPKSSSVKSFPRPLGWKQHLRSMLRTSAPSVLFSQLPIACHPSSFVEQLEPQQIGICCSYFKTCQSKFDLKSTLPNCRSDSVSISVWTYVRPDAFHANAIVCDERL